MTFGASPAGPSLPTFDNAEGLNNSVIAQLSVAGAHNAIVAANDANEIGSPGTSGKILIASVTVAGGGDQIGPNTWLEIKGQGLAAAGTAGGLLWSKALEFAQGKMPTTLGGISATVNGRAGRGPEVRRQSSGEATLRAQQNIASGDFPTRQRTKSS